MTVDVPAVVAAMAETSVQESDFAIAAGRMQRSFLRHRLELFDRRRGFELTHSELRINDLTVDATEAGGRDSLCAEQHVASISAIDLRVKLRDSNELYYRCAIRISGTGTGELTLRTSR